MTRHPRTPASRPAGAVDAAVENGPQTLCAGQETTMTRDEAIEALKLCPAGNHWLVLGTCDSCWVDQHRCPPTLEKAAASLRRAAEIGREAEQLLAKLRQAGVGMKL